MKIIRSFSVVGACSLSLVGIAHFQSSASAGPDSALPTPMVESLCLRKISLDLRDKGPSAEEISQLESGRALGEFIDDYLVSPEFEGVVRSWFLGKFPPTDISPEGVDIEEPARIATHIVLNDRDYREIMTGDFSVNADQTMRQVSDRPAAGVISTAAYMSAYVGGYRRNWAGQFLKDWGEVRLEALTLPPDSADDDLSPQSILENPSCAGCHGDEVWGVDYLASFAFCYDESGAYIGGECSGQWLTKQGSGLKDLGRIMADSKRFKANTVNYFFRQLFGRSLAAQETDYYLTMQQALTDSEYRIRPMLKTMLLSQEYCSN